MAEAWELEQGSTTELSTFAELEIRSWKAVFAHEKRPFPFRASKQIRRKAPLKLNLPLKLMQL